MKFLGKQTPAQLAELYQRSDLLILPSETEALPSVITEAMLSGLPFLASAVGGIPEQASGFGFLLTQRTVDQLSVDLAHLVEHYSQYSGASASMSNYARRTFSITSMLDAHLHLYRALAGRSVRRSSRRAFRPDPLIRAAVHLWGRAGSPVALSGPPLTAESSPEGL